MSVRRLDPHAERARRNRLHPRHHEFVRPAWRWTSGDGVTRINPHALGAIGPNGIKRIDRSGASVEAAASAGPQASAEPSRRQVRLEAPQAYVAVVPELPEGRLSDHDRDLFGLARQLAEARGGAEAGVAVVAITFQTEVAGLEEAGADRRVDLSSRVEADSYAPEARLAALAAMEAALAPAHWIFADDFPGGGDLGRRLAARLALAGDAAARAATRVWQFADGQTLSRAGDRQDIQREVARVLLALPECAEPVSETLHAATLLDLDALDHELSASDERAAGVADLGRVAVDPQQIPLAQAPFILSAGRGVSDWDGYHHAARVLGASEGASRVAVDDGYMPRSRQVGATGTFVSASCYVAVGISGAVQHLQGITKCQRVVAINSDPSCDMVKRADFAIIGDGDAVLAAVCAQLGQPRPESGDSRHEEVRHDAA
ncbi:FAD-binding protein [Salinicola sp. RZ23]|uniref:FAD-binding protein n=1 Tax=Salinicola sp. RZ23 TaxID=1949087 RepID=UPI000DA1CFEA|nr:FAD-binding protein [Salinicola sp. RZ23]